MQFWFILAYLVIGCVLIGYYIHLLYRRAAKPVFIIPTGVIQENDKYLEMGPEIARIYVSLSSFDCSKSVFEHISSGVVSRKNIYLKRIYLKKDGRNIIWLDSNNGSSVVIPENANGRLVTIRTGYYFPKPRDFPEPDDIDDQYCIICPDCLNEFSVNDAAFLIERREKIDENTSDLKEVGVISSNSGLWSGKRYRCFGTLSDFGMGYEILSDNSDINYHTVRVYDEGIFNAKKNTFKDIFNAKPDTLFGKTLGDVILKNGLRKRVCPHCGKLLPPRSGQYPTFLVAMLGYKGSGKTSFICSLIEQASKFAAVNTGWALNYEADASLLDSGIIDAYKKYIIKNGKEEGGTSPTTVDYNGYACFTLTRGRRGANFIFRDAAGEDLNKPEYLTENAGLFHKASALVCFTDLDDISSARGLDAYADTVANAIHAANLPVTMCAINKADELTEYLRPYTNAHARLKSDSVARLADCLDEESHSLLEASCFAKICFGQIFTTVARIASKAVFYPTISTYKGSYEEFEFKKCHPSTLSAFTILAKMLGL